MYSVPVACQLRPASPRDLKNARSGCVELKETHRAVISTRPRSFRSEAVNARPLGSTVIPILSHV